MYGQTKWWVYYKYINIYKYLKKYYYILSYVSYFVWKEVRSGARGNLGNDVLNYIIENILIKNEGGLNCGF